MGGADRCAVFNCNNDRRYKDRLIIKDHVKELKWHSCPPKWRSLWLRLINRADLAALTDNTRVCSNHFVLGRPYGLYPHPSMYLRGYEGVPSHVNNTDVQNLITSMERDMLVTETDYVKTRQGQVKRKQEPEKVCRVKKPLNALAEHDYTTAQSVPPVTEGATSFMQKSQDFETDAESSPKKQLMTSSYSVKNMQDEHSYDWRKKTCTCTKCDFCEANIEQIIEERDAALVNQAEAFEQAVAASAHGVQQPMYGKYSIDTLKDSNSLILMHTGLNSYDLFRYVYELVEPKLERMQYYKGSASSVLKKYQQQPECKPGPKRFLSFENELLLTLMKLKLNLTEQFLGHLFGVSASLISSILSTWLPLLSIELRPLLHWPTREEIQHYYPECFQKYRNVRAIIDCTEIPLQRPSLAKANKQIYSSYKSRPTAKLLVACTPTGTVSFVSKAAGGLMSDKEIVQRCGILDLLEPGDTLLADRGFNIQELLLHTQVKLEIPPFLKQRKQFTHADDQKTKQVANARIHVERVIGRLKDFNIMKSELPLDMYDLVDHITVIVAALVNLQPPIVPLCAR